MWLRDSVHGHTAIAFKTRGLKPRLFDPQTSLLFLSASVQV